MTFFVAVGGVVSNSYTFNVKTPEILHVHRYIQPQICINILQMPYLLFTPHHVAKDKPLSPAQNDDKFRSIFSDNLQPIATRRKKARGTLLVDEHCGSGCSIKRAPFSVSYYNEISGGHIGRAVVWRRCSAGPVLAPVHTTLKIHGIKFKDSQSTFNDTQFV